VDTGGRRSGVRPAEAADIAVAAARRGLEVRGVFTHGGHSYGLGEAARRAAREELDGLAAAVEGLQRVGLQVPVVSAGSTPTALRSAVEPVNEERPGTYVFGDRQQVAIDSCAPAEVALVVATTVVSRAVAGQLVVDAGTKSLGRETQRWLSGFGLFPSWPSVVLERLYDHHGVGVLPSGGPGPDAGSLLAVVPNHVSGGEPGARADRGRRRRCRRLLAGSGAVGGVSMCTYGSPDDPLREALSRVSRW
jgi:D-serine deaminase-like pyridoxal phosphate-dependent protein